MRGNLLLAVSSATLATFLLSPAAALAWPPRPFGAAYPNYNVMAYQNAARLAAMRAAIYQNAFRAALPPSAGPSLYGLPPTLYPLAFRRAAMQRGAEISWARQVAMSQAMVLNRLTGGGSSGGDGPAASGD